MWGKFIKKARIFRPAVISEAKKTRAQELREEVSNLVRFKRSEFECKCGCGQAGVDYELIFMPEIMRAELEALFNAAVVVEVTSGNRCPKHNSETPGAFVNSYHPKGMAGDFKFRFRNTGKYIDSKLLYDLACRLFPNKYGIGQYSNRIHLDCRKGKGRWKK